MTQPTSAPPTAPDSDTVRARYPSHAVTTLTPIAQGNAARIVARDASIDDDVIRLPSHSTMPAAAGTDTLSSSRIGIVSTSAATSAAASGTTMVNVIDGGGVTAGRVHHASATAPMPPNTTKAVVPATLLSRFHGRRPG